jgi:hypothetical protein
VTCCAFVAVLETLLKTYSMYYCVDLDKYKGIGRVWGPSKMVYSRPCRMQIVALLITGVILSLAAIYAIIGDFALAPPIKSTHPNMLHFQPTETEIMPGRVSDEFSPELRFEVRAFSNGNMGEDSSSSKKPTHVLIRQLGEGNDNDPFYELIETPIAEWNTELWILALAIAVLASALCLCSCCWCILPCCCSQGGYGYGSGGGGGRSCCQEILCLFCCYELFCDDCAIFDGAANTVAGYGEMV